MNPRRARIAAPLTPVAITRGVNIHHAVLIVAELSFQIHPLTARKYRSFRATGTDPDYQAGMDSEWNTLDRISFRYRLADRFGTSALKTHRGSMVVSWFNALRLRTLLNTQHHLSFHDEVRWLENHTKVNEVEQRILEIRIVVAPSTDYQSCSLVINWLQIKSPALFKCYVLFALDGEHAKWWCFWMQPNFVTDLELLPLRMDAIGVHVAADQVLEPVIAIEPSSRLAHLH
jgi:hypothetical protein